MPSIEAPSDRHISRVNLVAFATSACTQKGGSNAGSHTSAPLGSHRPAFKTDAFIGPLLLLFGRVKPSRGLLAQLALLAPLREPGAPWETFCGSRTNSEKTRMELPMINLLVESRLQDLAPCNLAEAAIRLRSFSSTRDIPISSVRAGCTRFPPVP
jgi:hypothetical protein